MGMKTFILSSLFLGGFLAASLAATPEEINAANATRTQPGASIRDGFTLRGTETVMTHNGVTTKLERDVLLRNGMRVHANGNITSRDGGTTSLRPNQLLTFDGDIEEVALTPDGVAPLSAIAEGPSPRGTAGAARDGITVVNGEAFLTRDGVAERIRADVRLPNGAVAKSDGTVVLSNGNSIALRSDQILDLKGVLHDMRVRPAALGQRSTAPR
jgi:hypothetical protein